MFQTSKSDTLRIVIISLLVLILVFVWAGFMMLDKKIDNALKNKLNNIKSGFSLTEVLIALAVVAVIAVLIIPVVTTRAQNRSFSVGYESEVKQMLTSLQD